MVKNVTDKYIEAEATGPDGKKTIEKIPYGLLVWATGNAVRPVVKDLMAQIPAQKDSRRGLAVNEYLVVNGAENVWAVGDCAIANYAPTAQVASQEGAFLARMFNSLSRTDALETRLAELSEQQATAPNKEVRTQAFEEIKETQRQLRRVKQIRPFEYSHQGSLAYSKFQTFPQALPGANKKQLVVIELSPTSAGSVVTSQVAEPSLIGSGRVHI